jgi:hypothetical protein
MLFYTIFRSHALYRHCATRNRILLGPLHVTSQHHGTPAVKFKIHNWYKHENHHRIPSSGSCQSSIPYTLDFLGFITLFIPVSSLVNQYRAEPTRAVLLAKANDRQPKDEMQQIRDKDGV